MKIAGQRIEGHISWYSRNRLNYSGGGEQNALPFISRVEDIPEYFPLDKNGMRSIERVSARYPFRIPRYYLNLIDAGRKDCPLRLQAVPDEYEIGQNTGITDPLHEGKHSVTPVFVKRHEGRGVFLVSGECAMYCRFCNRKRIVGKGWDPSAFFDETLDYIDSDKCLQEVILSGGDPLMVSAQTLDYLIGRIRSGGHVKTIRISSRMPVVWPEGITKEHFDVFRRHRPLWIVIHTNHPKELTEQFALVARKLLDSGNALIGQTVLLRQVNDCPYTLKNLFESLVVHGVKPYYIFQLDEVQGAGHFKVPVERGLAIMKRLRSIASGLAIPHYAMDLTGGLGKVPLENTYIRKGWGKTLIVSTPEGFTGTYHDDGKARDCGTCKLCEE